MAEITAFLLVLGVLLAVVTLVGHGIWVFLSLLFGSRRSKLPSDEPSGPAKIARRACPRCGTAFDVNEYTCGVCGWPAGSRERSGQLALRTVREQVERLARLGLVDGMARDRLVDAVIEQERRVAALEVTAARGTVSASGTPQAEIERPAPAELMPADAGRMAPSVPEQPAASLAAASDAPPLPSQEVRAPAPLGERARKFAASREAALAEPVAHKSSEPPKQREALSRLLAAFMEENNIRWGELVGGLLIVGCSIALVISFWSQIAERPLLKFVLFNGVTAALFGIGLYTDRRWKIQTTSHGLLVIATLLVPLNFLAIAAFTQASPPSDVLTLCGEAVSLVVFAGLVWLAGRILVPDAALLLVVGVMAPSLMQLVVRRFAGPGVSLAWLYGLAAAPLASYLATTVAVARRRWANTPSPGSITRHPLPKGEGLSEADAPRLLAFLGLVSQATLLPLALLAYMSPPRYETLHRLSPLLVTCGLPALLVGLLFWRRGEASQATGGSLTLDPSHSGDSSNLILDDKRLSTGMQTAGIAVGVLGALVMAAAVVLAWPEPATLLPTALVTAAVLTVVAVWFGIPAAHVPAGMALAAAWLVGFHLVRGNVTWTLSSYEPLADALLSATSGHALVPLVGVFGAIGWALSRKRWREHGRMVGLVAAATAAVSLGLVVWFGWGRVGDPQGAIWTLAIYSVAALAAAAVLARAPLAWAAVVLLLATVVQGVVYRFGAAWELERPWLVALLAFASLAVALYGGLRGLLRRGQANLQSALSWSALAASIGAVAMLAATAWMTSAESLAVYLAWLAVVWLVLAGLVGWPALFALSQVAVVLAIVCGVTAAVEAREWYVASPRPRLDPWFLEAQGLALAAYCLAMGAVWGLRGRSQYQIFADPSPRPSPEYRGGEFGIGAKPQATAWVVEQAVEIGLVAIMIWVAAYAALPGIAQELDPLAVARGTGAAVRVVTPIEQFEIAAIPHAHAADRGGWLLVTVVAAVLAVGLWRGGRGWRVLGLLAAGLTVCALLAARWELEVAVASALRWLLAGTFAAVSVPVWLARRDRSGKIAPALFPPALAEPVAHRVRDFLVAAVVLVYVLMGVYVGQAALMRAGLPRDLDWLWPYLACWAVVGGVAAVLASRVSEARSSDGARTSWALHVRDVLLLLAGAPLVVMSLFAVATALDQHPIVGPELGSWFRRIGWDVSYGVPLAVTGLVFAGYALRDRSPGFAFAAGLLFNTVATIVVLMRLARGGGMLDAAAWVTVAQVNAIVAGVVALVWLGAVARNRRQKTLADFGELPSAGSGSDFGELSRAELVEDSRVEPVAPDNRVPLALPVPVLLVTQVALAAALCGAFLVPAAVDLAWEPWVTAWASAADGLLGWTAVVLATAAAVWINGRRGVSLNGVGLFAAALVALVALTTTHWETGNWLAFHTLLVGCSAAAWLVPVATRSAGRLIASDEAEAAPLALSAMAVRLFAIAAVIMALWNASNDPARPWWTIAALVAISARNVWIAWYERRRGFMWIAAVLASIAANNWWEHTGSVWLGSGGVGFIDALEWLWFNAVVLAAMALVSVWVEHRRILPPMSQPRGWLGLAYHRFAAWAIVTGLLAATGVGLAADLMGDSIPMNLPLAWAAWIAAAVTALACCWDPTVRWPVASLYCVGLLAVGLFLDGLDLQPPLFQWALALALSAYSLATSALWSVRDRLRAVARQWGVPAAATDAQPTAWHAGSGHSWLVPANVLIGVGVLMLVWWIELSMENSIERMVAAYAVGAQAFALGLLARGSVRTPLQYVALVWGVMFGVAFGWAWLSPDFPAPWLHRLVVSAAAVAIAVVVYGFGLVKFLKQENEWTRAAGQLVPLLAAAAVMLILAVLGIETAAYMRQGQVPIRLAAAVTVGLALVGLAVAALVAALAPGRDPLGLSERGRTLYVYAAEALAALLFLHIRVTQPWLFTGWFLQFWPLVVMGIAFVGVGLGELFQRRRQRVLSEPLQTTGALLPLLPALGFWVMSSQLYQVHYSLLLLSIGVLYAGLSVLRGSFLYGMLAAVAANGSLWFLLYRGDGLSFFEHPQLWLIPPALCALAAGYINRERMSREQSAALRYAAAMVIYVSSTADIFINGVAEAPWLPAVLAGLSIAGVLAGIMLRVQSFLYLGTTFLVVALMTIIWHAAEQHWWIWCVAGIVTGALIIALFGLFEKRRDDVLRVVEQLKHWEA